MASGCKKKQLDRSPLRMKNARAHSLKNKIAKLEKQLATNPADISAANALAQARYDLKKGVY